MTHTLNSESNRHASSEERKGMLSYSEGKDGAAIIPTGNRSNNVKKKNLEGFYDTKQHRNLSSRQGETNNNLSD
jgi:hypothetical protein